MPVSVVVGGQYGSEGKGKLLSYLATAADCPTAMVRCGGSNAGHTATGDGLSFLLRQLPSGVVSDTCQLFLAPGMLIDLAVLRNELAECHVGPERLVIDRNATVVSEDDRRDEHRFGLESRVGSTLSGTGMATAKKVLRGADVVLASSIAELQPFVGDVPALLNDALDRGTTVFVEGTQGFGLSLHHADCYPYATSRDTTAAAFLSEAGLSPLQVSEIVMVVRSYPIRVAGNSGPMIGEITWDELTKRSGYPNALAEYTTVTRKLRRVGEFDWHLVERAARVNRPTRLALHGADYLSYADRDKTAWADLSHHTRDFVDRLEERMGLPVDFIFTGPSEHAIVDRRATASRLQGTDLANTDRSPVEAVL